MVNRFLFRRVKSAFFATVPGNHDFWINAAPTQYVTTDQLGNGFMQYYGQDTVSSLMNDCESGSGLPYDFETHPDLGIYFIFNLQ